MQQGLNVGKRALVAVAAAALLTTAEAGAQAPAGSVTPGAAVVEPTPVPTLPPLPPLTAPSETMTPTAAPVQPTAPLAATTATTTGGPVTRPTEAPRPPETTGGLPSSVVILLGVGVFVLVATLVVVLTVLLKKPVVINVPSRSASPPPPPLPEGPAPAAWTDGNVRAGQPPAGVLETLPGRFVILEGDRQTDLRIFRTAPGERVETTIGRDAGPPYRHIQLLPASVSGKHAKLVFDKGSYSLINYSRTNPTRVNSEEMEENASRRLVDGDRIEIGDIAMTYRES